MTPEQFNKHVAAIAAALHAQPGIDNVSVISVADTEGTLPEIMVTVGDADLALTIAPV